jgi:hypothetical protein
MAEALEHHKDLIGSVLPRNPRTWQRFAHRLALNRSILDAIAQERQLPETWASGDMEVAFIKLQLLGFRWPAFLRALGDFNSLIAFEEVVRDAHVESREFRALVAQKHPKDALRESSTKSDALPEGAWPFVADLDLLRFLGRDPKLGVGEKDRPVLEKIFSMEMPHASPAPTTVPQTGTPAGAI